MSEFVLKRCPGAFALGFALALASHSPVSGYRLQSYSYTYTPPQYKRPHGYDYGYDYGGGYGGYDFDSWDEAAIEEATTQALELGAFCYLWHRLYDLVYSGWQAREANDFKSCCGKLYCCSGLFNMHTYSRCGASCCRLFNCRKCWCDENLTCNARNWPLYWDIGYECTNLLCAIPVGVKDAIGCFCMMCINDKGTEKCYRGYTCYGWWTTPGWKPTGYVIWSRDSLVMLCKVGKFLGILPNK